MSNEWNSGSADILQAITGYSDYPIYFMVDGEEICDPYECVYTLHKMHKVKISKITKWNDIYFDNDTAFRCYVESSIWDDDLSAGENEKAVDRIAESQRWEPCILIYTGA